MRRSPSPRATRPSRARLGLPLALLGVGLVPLAWPAAASAAPPVGVPTLPGEDATEPTAPPPDVTEPPTDVTDSPPDIVEPAPTDPPVDDVAGPSPDDPPPPPVDRPVPLVSPVSPAPAIAPADPPDPDQPSEEDVGSVSLRIEPGIGLCLGRGCRHFRIGDATGSIGVGGSLAAHVAYRAARHLSFEVGGLAAIHGNDIDSGPTSMWFLTQAGPRLHLFGGRFPAEPVVGLHVGWVRSLVRWTDAGSAADGLALGADVGVQWRINQRLGLAFLGSATLPYWTRVCEVDRGIRDCHRRSELTDHDLQRYFFVTSVALTVRLR
jgi:hypothetical protein